jgi:hypothetical protein
MAKPIFVIKVDREVLLISSKMEEFRKVFDSICKSIGDEYHILAMTKEYDVSVLNGELFEVREEQWEHILKIIKGESE